MLKVSINNHYNNFGTFRQTVGHCIHSTVAFFEYVDFWPKIAIFLTACYTKSKYLL